MAALVSPAPVCAQSNPPFQNPSLDSDCYFPQIGVPGEIDTLYGSVGRQLLGDPIIKNMGTKPDGSYGNILIGNLVPPPSSIFFQYTLTQVPTGPGFNLHQMVQYLQKLNAENGQTNLGATNSLSNGFILGHFRDQQHLDILAGTQIYWADDNGNYDSTRFTVLTENIPLGNSGIRGGPILPYYATHLTSDTIDDIVLSAYTDNTDTFPPYVSHDTAYVVLFRGGQQLYGKDTVSEDTSALLYPMTPNSADFQYCTQADFRGVGRDDLIVSDIGTNLCYYKNDPPFSLSQFAQAVAKDTIFAEWQNPRLANDGTGEQTWFTMRALPKAAGDQSVDFIPVWDTVNTNGNVSPGIFIFRGGSDFGSHRITLDSAAFVIPQPSIFSDDNWPYNLEDAGDMTGTGNNVLHVCAYNSGYAWTTFYVTGKALNDKIDIYIDPGNFSEGTFGDTLTANADSLEDFLMGVPTAINPQGTLAPGALWLLYGSSQIPVHLNPEFSDVKSIPQENGAGLTLAPNPAQSWSVATIVWPEAEDAEYEVYNILGSVVQSGPIRLLGGAEQQRIYFPNLASGVYVLIIHGSLNEARAKLVIAR